MSDPKREYTTAALIELAATDGHEVTAVQLAKWHRFGLLPRPRKQPLGKGRGSESRYPSETAPWLLTLLRIHENEHRLLYVAWRLWWAKYPVPITRLRELMARVADKLDEQRDTLAVQTPDERAASAERMYRKELSPEARPVIGRARQRVRKDSPRLFEVLYGALSDGFDPSDADLGLIAKASGLAVMGPSKPLGKPLPLIDAAGRSSLGAWAESMRQPMRPLLDATTDEELVAARDAVLEHLATAQGVVNLNRELRVKGDIAVTDWHPPADVATQVAFVFAFVSMRANAERSPAAEALLAQASDAGQLVWSYELVRALRVSPTFADLLGTDRVREAMTNPTRGGSLARDLQQRIDENRAEAWALAKRAGLLGK